MRKTTACYAALAALPFLAFCEAKPAAICGYGSDVHAIVGDIMKPNRYVYEAFVNKWLPPEEFPKYAVVYFGEKLDGEAKGKNWKDDDSRAAIERYLDDGGTVVVAGEYFLRQLMGFENKKTPDPLRARIIHRNRLFVRTRVEYGRAGKSLGFADDAGNFVTTPEGRHVDEIKADYAAIFASVTNLAVHPVTVARNRHGQKEMRVEVGDYLFTFVNDEIPDYFHAGIIACEGRNFFYDFRVDPQ